VNPGVIRGTNYFNFVFYVTAIEVTVIMLCQRKGLLTACVLQGKRTKLSCPVWRQCTGILLEGLINITKSLTWIASLWIARCIVAPTDEGKIAL